MRRHAHLLRAVLVLATICLGCMGPTLPDSEEDGDAGAPAAGGVTGEGGKFQPNGSGGSRAPSGSGGSYQPVGSGGAGPSGGEGGAFGEGGASGEEPGDAGSAPDGA